MIAKLIDWFSQPEEEENQELSVAVATSVLFFEIIRADHSLSEDEWVVFRKLLLTHFPEQAQNLEALMDEARFISENAVDLAQFTRIINERCEHTQKLHIVESLWRLALADSILDGHEEHLIRRISDLLYLPHSEFIKSKLRVQGG